MLKAVFFDLDGPLVDSKIDFQKMKRRTIKLLEASGVRQGFLKNDMLNYIIDTRARDYLKKKGASEEKIQKVFEKVDEILLEIELEAVESATLIEGVLETLEELRMQGLKIGIVTRGSREYVTGILKKLDLWRLVDAVAARDDVSNPKPNPEHPRHLMKILGVKPSETLLVGDHHMDALCAKNAGIKFFLVPRTKTDLKEHGCKSLRDIRDLVSELTH